MENRKVKQERVKEVGYGRNITYSCMKMEK
jgi:hypothetical protein